MNTRLNVRCTLAAKAVPPEPPPLAQIRPHQGIGIVRDGPTQNNTPSTQLRDISRPQ